jgi:hypothetical protein
MYVHIYITMGTGSFPGLKRPQRGVDHPPPSSAEVKERLKLNIYSPSRPLWSVIGQTTFVCVCIDTHTHTHTHMFLYAQTHSPCDIAMEVSPFITKYVLYVVSVKLNMIISCTCQCILKGSGLSTQNFFQIRSYSKVINTETVSERLPVNLTGELYLLTYDIQRCVIYLVVIKI